MDFVSSEELHGHEEDVGDLSDRLIRRDGCSCCKKELELNRNPFNIEVVSSEHCLAVDLLLRKVHNPLDMSLNVGTVGHIVIAFSRVASIVCVFIFLGLIFKFQVLDNVVSILELLLALTRCACVYSGHDRCEWRRAAWVGACAK